MDWEVGYGSGIREWREDHFVYFDLTNGWYPTLYCAIFCHRCVDLSVYMLWWGKWIGSARSRLGAANRLYIKLTSPLYGTS